MLSLFILSRKGLYQLTICKNCNHTWECPNCDANLITYRKTDGSLELFCHQCQTNHNYPTNCSVCGYKDIVSKYGAIDDLEENMVAEGTKVYRLDLAKFNKKQTSPIDIAKMQSVDTFLTTRLYDPSLKYEEFDRIIFVNAENLLASPDYLVQEDTIKSLAEVFLRTHEDAEIIFDVINKDTSLMQKIAKLSISNPNRQTILNWYSDFLLEENQARQKFGFPPHKNVLLLTTQEKQKQNSYDKLKQIQIELKKYLPLMPELEISNPYPARFFRRKNMYSQHLLIKYPRGYSKFAQLREIITNLTEVYGIQIRLNPRHLF